VTRFLFVVPPLTGHINPTVSVGRALEKRGHEVAWIGFPEPAAQLLPAGSRLLPVFESLPADVVNAIFAKFDGLRGASALKALWEDFLVPLARGMVSGVEAAIDSFRPDVLIVDQQALGGALVAQRRGLPWVTSATTSGEFADPFAGLPRVREWVEGLLTGLQDEFAVPQAQRGADLRFSDHLVLLYSSRELVGGNHAFPAHYAFVGPSFHERHEQTPFDWSRLLPQRRILVSLGTVQSNRSQRFFAAALEAFADAPFQVILIAPPQTLGPVPDHVLVCERVPQLALLEHLDAVLCHGGHNTVCETLARGLPLVVAPIRDDQPVVAEQVVQSGAGVRVSFGRIRPVDLRTAVDKVLDEPAYREAARRIAASFAAAGGPERAVELLEKVA
jgi:MGT family glycosyltransferase